MTRQSMRIMNADPATTGARKCNNFRSLTMMKGWIDMEYKRGLGEVKLSRSALQSEAFTSLSNVTDNPIKGSRLDSLTY
ncbi:hypothetical protein L1887_30757 [Cichorium endivia]|nr:hypothetical protein L1887_30757 [Cichorium endivia]